MVIIIEITLYGIKISGTACRAKLAQTLKSLGYKSSEADADIWMKLDLNTN